MTADKWNTKLCYKPSIYIYFWIDHSLTLNGNCVTKEHVVVCLKLRDKDGVTEIESPKTRKLNIKIFGK